MDQQDRSMSGSETSEADWHHGLLSLVGDEIRGKPRAVAPLWPR